MMTPKQFEFFFQLIEAACKYAYDQGRKEHADKRETADKFIMSKAAKLTVQTNFKKQFPNG